MTRACSWRRVRGAWRVLLVAAIPAAAPVPAAWAQGSVGLSKPEPAVFRRFVLEVELGALVPTGVMADYYSSAVAGAAVFGVRVTPLIQLDASLVGGSGALGYARTDLPLVGGGTFDTQDVERFLMLGGRLVIPVAGERTQISLGGGYVNTQYSEQAPSNVTCLSCADPTSGSGFYALGQFGQRLGRPQRVSIGLSVRMMQASMDYDPSNPGTVKATDRWLAITGTVGWHF